MPLNTVDVSNYSGELTREDLAAWKDTGVAMVIVQAVAPPPGYPPEVDRQQAQAILDAGLKLGVYVFHWLGTRIAYDNAQRFASYGFPVERWWGDFEDTTLGDPAQREQEITDLLGYLDTLGGKRPSGGYSGRWWTDGYLPTGSQVFANRAIWVAQYDNVATLAASALCGGEVMVHQYLGTSTLDGVRSVDLNVADPNEFTPQSVTRATPDDFPFPDWRQSAIAYRGALDAMGQDLETARHQLDDHKASATSAIAELHDATSRLARIRALANSPSHIQTIGQIRALSA